MNIKFKIIFFVDGLLDVETVEDSTLRKCYMLTEILNENNVFTSPALYFIPHAYTPKECQ